MTGENHVKVNNPTEKTKVAHLLWPLIATWHL